MYRRILTRTTAWFSMTGLVARLPISMIGLGIVLLVQHRTGSYAFAGALSATSTVASAATSVPQGRLLDRFGQRPVLRMAITGWGLGLAAAMASLEAGWPRWTTYALIAFSGAALPGVGTCARARWSHVLDGDEAALHTAFSFEAALDELVFIIGPVVVTLLATAVEPAAGLVAALVAGVGGTFAFSSLRSSEPPADPGAGSAPERGSLHWGVIAPLTVQNLALGVLFGGAEVVTAAFAREQGHTSLAGVLLACWSFGSLAAGLVCGLLAGRIRERPVLLIGSLGLAVASVPLLWISSIAWMTITLLVGGVAISPTLIAARALAEQVLPPGRMTEGMAFLTTGLALGIAPGAALGGVVIDAHGANAAYLVCLGGALVALLAALAVRMPDGVGAHEALAEQLA